MAQQVSGGTKGHQPGPLAPFPGILGGVTAEVSGALCGHGLSLILCLAPDVGSLLLLSVPRIGQDMDGQCGLGGPGVVGGGAHHYQELKPEESWAARCCQPFMRTALTPLLPDLAWPLCQGLQKECGIWWLTVICW